MQRRTRYLFIGLGALFFLIAAPLLVFYIGGIRYDFGDNEYLRTGILSVETEPKNAQVSLDGEVKGNTPSDFRFLEPKEYLVTITKDGYWDWSKRLEVKEGKATIAANTLDNIYLLRKDSQPQTVDENVRDYSLNNNDLLYLTNTSINFIPSNNIAQSKTLTLSDPFDQLLPSDQGNYVLVMNQQKKMVLNVSAWQIYDVTSSLTNTTHPLVTDNGWVLALKKDVLVRIDPVTLAEVQLLQSVGSFNVLGQNLYYTQTIAGKTILAVVPLVTADSTLAQILLDPLLPEVADAQLLITERRDVLIFKNSTLYKVNSSLDTAATGVTQVFFDAKRSLLLYATASELSWYEFTTNRSHLITRNTQAITSAQMAPQIGYAFYLQNNAVQAMELDSTDRQNNYSLLTLTSGQKLRLDSNAENLYLLDGPILKVLNMR